MDIIKKLKLPDYISISCLILSIAAIWLVLEGEFNFAIILSAFAVVLDTLDGIIARKMNLTSKFGALLDTYIDLVNYLIFGSILLRGYIGNSIFVFILICMMIVFGIMRLARLNIEGLKSDGEKNYLEGLTTVHMSFAVISGYFLQEFLKVHDYIILFILGVFAFLMISKIKVYKGKMYPIMFGFLIIFVFMALYIEYS